MKSANDFPDYPDIFPRKVKMEEIAGMEVVVLSADVTPGEKGNYITFVGEFPDTSERITFSCGGKRIVEFYVQRDPVEDYPHLARFVLAGSMWIIPPADWIAPEIQAEF